MQAIAKHVFGLKSILWLYDPRGKHPPVLSDVIPSRLIPHAYSAFVDWCLADSTPNASACAPGDGPQNLAELQNTLKVFVNSPKEQVSLNFTPCILAPPVKPIVRSLRVFYETLCVHVGSHDTGARTVHARCGSLQVYLSHHEEAQMDHASHS